VQVQYAQWLTRRKSESGVVFEYRLPLAADGEPPIIGEFSAKVDVKGMTSRSIRSGYGATFDDGVVAVRKSDFRPTADFVVEIETAVEKEPARMYVAESLSMNEEDSLDDPGSYVFVRAEAPEIRRDLGARIAVVLDTSSSMDSGAFEVGRGLVESLVRSLGPSDHVVVFGADSRPRAVGPETAGAVDDERRNAILDGLAGLRLGGGTDIGLSLETAANQLDSDDPTGLVVYIGDGWPTLGDLAPKEIQDRLARRPGGAPRVAAVAVGTRSNRTGLSSIVRNYGSLFYVNEPSEASEVANQLIVEAVQPTVASVRLDLGPDAELVYPRGGRAVVSGSTVFSVGRLLGKPPERVTLRWMGKAGEESEVLSTALRPAADIADVRKRWGMARIEDLVLRSRGREAVVDVAVREELLTPWTGLSTGASRGSSCADLPIVGRALDLGASNNVFFSNSVMTPDSVGSSMMDLSVAPPLFKGIGDRGYEEAVRMAAKRRINRAAAGIRTCRDARLAYRPDLDGMLWVGFDLDGVGRASNVKVVGSGTSNDPALFACVGSVLSSLSYPASGLNRKVVVRHEIRLPPAKPTGRTTCSALSRVPIQARRGVWAKRLESVRDGTARADAFTVYSLANTVYSHAKQRCELQSWAANRALLDLVLAVPGMNYASVALLAASLDVSGDSDAADYLRREAMQRAGSPEDVRGARAALLADEGYPVDLFDKQYKACKTNDERLAVVKRYLGLAPHDIKLRRLHLALLGVTGDRDAIVRESAAIRGDLFSDATLIADAGTALGRLGDDAGSMRMFAEIVERAPRDPWARAYAGDRLQREGWYDAALMMYGPLEYSMPMDQSIMLRVAMAHAGAGRIDLAGRVLTRLSQTSGRSVGANMSDLASDVAAMYLSSYLSGSVGESGDGMSSVERDELVRRSIELLQRSVGMSVVVQVPPLVPLGDVRLLRGLTGSREVRLPSAVVESLGLYRVVVGQEDGDVVLVLRATAAMIPWEPIRVRVNAVLGRGPTEPPRVVVRELDLLQDGKPVELRWDGEGWL